MIYLHPATPVFQTAEKYHSEKTVVKRMFWRYGKLPEAVDFENDLVVNIEDRLGYTLVPLEPETMIRAARFEAGKRQKRTSQGRTDNRRTSELRAEAAVAPCQG